MVDKKNQVPLPSNYVTLAQLRERWLMQKEKELKEEQEQQLLQQEQQPELHQSNPRGHRQRQPKTRQRARRVVQTHETASGSAAGNRQPKKFVPKNQKFSENNRVATEVRCEKHETMEAKADIGDENAGQDGNKESKKKKKKKKKLNWKARARKEKKNLAEDAAQSTMEGDKKVADVQKVDDKTEIKIESNSSTSNNLVMEVEEKLGTLSVNSGTGSGKQNSRLWQHTSFRGYQRTYGGRKYNSGPYGDRKYNNGPYGGRFRSQETQRRTGDEKMWIRKNEDSEGNVDKKTWGDSNVDRIDMASVARKRKESLQ